MDSEALGVLKDILFELQLIRQKLDRIEDNSHHIQIDVSSVDSKLDDVTVALQDLDK